MTHEEYEELINGTLPAVTICGVTFGAGSILRKMDPVAFNEEYWSVVHSIEETEETV